MSRYSAGLVQSINMAVWHNALLEIVLEVTLVLAINKKLLSRQIKIIKCMTYTVDIITMYISTCLHIDLNE